MIPSETSTEILSSDAIVIGSGMGGLTVAALLAGDGYKTTVLEAAHVAGGCSSSFTRKGYVFESGATTLIGFDQHQPLRRLEELTGIQIPRTELSPGMTVHIDGEPVVRYKDRAQWIAEAGRVFGNPEQQRLFWETCFHVSDVVWKVSERNTSFPPQKAGDWLELMLRNNPLDALVLRYAFRSVLDVMQEFQIHTASFRRFIDEQLMITAQATSEEVPFLFGAAGITYTNYSNFYVEGGLLEMVRSIESFITGRGSQVLTRRRVTGLRQDADQNYVVETSSGQRYRAPLVYANIPVWNMSEITQGAMQRYFAGESARYEKAWGAFTMGIVTSDTYQSDMTLHHQIHLPEPMPGTGARSIFVSMSARGDEKRAKSGTRTLNISCHTETAPWFELNGAYDQTKQAVEQWILESLRRYLPGFSQAEVLLSFGSTPVTWQNWVYRKEGRVGGIPQSMKRSLLDWSAAMPPFEGLYLCGDTVYPGQGIPGVTLSGINVYYRSEKIRKKRTSVNRR